MGPFVIPAIVIGGMAVATIASGKRQEQPGTPDMPQNPTVTDLGQFPLAVRPSALPSSYGVQTTELEPYRAHRKLKRAPRPKPPKNKKSVANLLVQELPTAVEAARHRFLRSSAVQDVRQGDGEILIELDPSSTASVLIPPDYLGWPVRMITHERQR